MEYRIFKLAFRTAVHFGNRSLEDHEYILHSDTLFSALCTEAVKMGNETLNRLYRCAEDGNMLLSDAFPYVGEQYLIPKPMKYIEHKESADRSVREKDYKKLTYIPHGQLNQYLQGEIDLHKAKACINNIGEAEIRQMAQIVPNADSMPYRVGVFHFYEKDDQHDESGLYVIAGYESDDVLKLLEELFTALSVTGIGGRRSTGLGKFDLYKKKLPEDLERRVNSEAEDYMTLSSALPNDEELDVLLENAQYRLIKRSGFVASESYNPTPLRKRDLYVCAAGSCFKNRFKGCIANVSSHGTHPVYRYAKPLFMSIDKEA